MDLSALAGELATLRRAMKGEATEPGHDAAVGEVAKAEQTARAKDSSKVAELEGGGEMGFRRGDEDRHHAGV